MVLTLLNGATTAGAKIHDGRPARVPKAPACHTPRNLVSKEYRGSVRLRQDGSTMLPPNPLADAAESDSDDVEFVRRSHEGDQEALETLVQRHQDWVYNIVLRMVYHPQDAEDA